MPAPAMYEQTLFAAANAHAKTQVRRQRRSRADARRGKAAHARKEQRAHKQRDSVTEVIHTDEEAQGAKKQAYLHLRAS
eukprot:6213430-Pleurochrysis_carterae.AAC.9